MSRPLVRFCPSRRYLLFALLALAGAGLSAWSGMSWSDPGWRVVSFVAAAGFGLTSAAILALALRPAVEIHEAFLRYGRREISWTEIRRVDQTRWLVPLAVMLTLEEDRRVLLMHLGDLDSSTSLLRHLRRYSRQALIEGIPYRQFWGEPANSTRKPAPLDRYPLLRPEDEQEVERMFQRLKSAGRLDRHATDEKNTEK